MKNFLEISFLIPYWDNISVQVRKYCEFKFKVFRSDYPFLNFLILKSCETRTPAKKH